MNKTSYFTLIIYTEMSELWRVESLRERQGYSSDLLGMFWPKQQLTTGSFKANIKQTLAETSICSTSSAQWEGVLVHGESPVASNCCCKVTKAVTYIWVTSMMFLGDHRFLAMFRYGYLTWMLVQIHGRPWAQVSSLKYATTREQIAAFSSFSVLRISIVCFSECKTPPNFYLLSFRGSSWGIYYQIFAL